MIAQLVNDIKCQLANATYDNLISDRYGLACNKVFLNEKALSVELILLENYKLLGLSAKDYEKIANRNYSGLFTKFSYINDVQDIKLRDESKVFNTTIINNNNITQSETWDQNQW